MSGTMQIRFAADAPAAVVEVLSPDLVSVGQYALQGGQQKAVAVPSEGSFVRVRLPSGRNVTLRHPGDLNYMITRADLEQASPKEKTPRTSPKSIRDLRSYMGTPLSTDNGKWKVEKEWGGFESFETVGTLRLGRDIDLQWSALGEACRSSDGKELAFSPRPRYDPYTLELQHSGTIVSIRLPGNVESVRVSLNELSVARILSIRVATSNRLADAISGYLTRSDLYAADAMVEPWLDDAEELLRDKIADPYSATVGAYLLLRLERYDRMHDWVGNLARWFPFLPDGMVILALQNIRQGLKLDEARMDLLDAADQDVLPLHTEGVRLLADGLRQLGDEGAAALARLARRASRVIWTSPFTTTVTESSLEKPEARPLTYEVDYLTHP